MLYQHYIELNLSINTLTIGSNKKKWAKRKKIIHQEYWSRRSIAPELHYMQQTEQESIECSSTRRYDRSKKHRTVQSINEIAKIEWVLESFETPITQTQQQAPQVAWQDKREPQQSFEHLYLCVVPNGRSSRYPRSWSSAKKLWMRRKEYHCRFDLIWIDIDIWFISNPVPWRTSWGWRPAARVTSCSIG